MNILYISISFPKEQDGKNLYTDLAEEIAKKHNITVLATEEKKKTSKTSINKERNIEVLRVKVGNMFNVSLIEKAISYIMLPYFVKRAIKNNLRDKKYDMVLYTAPPITVNKIVKYAKRKFNCMAYLMQKDIFPQNAVDIGIMKKFSPTYFYFRRKERNLYNISDRIGCMSHKNMTYIVEHNLNIRNINEKVELFPNTIKLGTIEKCNRDLVKEKYNIPKDKVIALYGGNFGRPQGIDYLVEILEYYKKNDKVFWILVGKGTEKGKLEKIIKEKQIENVLLLDYIPSKEYNKILTIADIGLVFLDKRFTIPNIPSRLLSYLEYSIPVLAATDKNTDFSKILEENNIGVWCESNKVEDFVVKMDKYTEGPEERIQIGKNGRKYLEENLTTEKSVKILEEAYRKFKMEEN